MNSKSDEEDDVIDEADLDKPVVPEKYAISSFGIDFDVSGLVNRLNRKGVLIPAFQRNFVWKQDEASKFIESLLLGLPVPGVFLAKEKSGEKLLVIDGQQRLKSLQFFYAGVFDPKEGEETTKEFDLVEVQPEFEGLTYATLEEDDRERLDNSVIHATIIKQDSPDESENTSLYYIFDRLNSTGRKLTPQEIRSALYHGPLLDCIKALNTNKSWRKIFGKENERLKDRELILRFLSLFLRQEKYEKPMEDFLNKFCLRYQNADAKFTGKCEKLFSSAIEEIVKSIGDRAFRPKRAINAAVFDSVMVGLARRLQKGVIRDRSALKRAYDELMANANFLSLTSKSTADPANVARRIEIAESAFATVK